MLKEKPLHPLTVIITKSVIQGFLCNFSDFCSKYHMLRNRKEIKFPLCRILALIYLSTFEAFQLLGKIYFILNLNSLDVSHFSSKHMLLKGMLR